MDILKKIEDMRKERGWSYYTLAGITQSTLMNMFSRGTQPSVKTLTALCEAYGVSLSQFFDEGEEHAVLSREEAELLSAYRKLPANEKRAVSALIGQLKR